MAAREEHETDEFVLEQTLFQENGVWFYHVPPGQVSTLSPRADSWDPEHPFLTGSLQIVQRGDACLLKLFEPLKPVDGDDSSSASSGPSADSAFAARRTLFAQCPIEITKELGLDVYVQDCVDSSRYFMIRVEDEETKRRAYVGIGFPERASAFNFKATLQDHAKYALRQLEAAALSALSLDDSSSSSGDSAATASSGAAPSPTKSQTYSLPEGQTMRINLKLPTTSDGSEKLQRRRSSSGGDGASGPVKVPLIPPPPGDLTPSSLSPAATAAVPKAAQTQAASVVADDDEDWGDFTSA